ncbi:MAG TPA: dihydropteroate synthase [Paenirhodobacter sp.]
MKQYYRPIVQTDALRPRTALPVAGGWGWFTHAQVLSRQGPQGMIAAGNLPPDVLHRIAAPRAPVAGLDFHRPQIMGILNVTPDSFSDGGRFNATEQAVARARELTDAGADMLDLGGESTRPGADDVPVPEEIARTAPVIAALRAGGYRTPISIDTRKAGVAAAALAAGADLVNDVTAMEFDPAMAASVGTAPVCLMHAQGDPATMQVAPHYDDVLLDVYDYLHDRIAVAEAAGIARDRIITDPGIGFGKTLAHNLALLRGLSLFHALGCPILLGVSRKGFIGKVGGAGVARDRMPGTLAVTLAGVAQGVQIHRVHDVAEIAQGLRLWGAINQEQEYVGDAQ